MNRDILLGVSLSLVLHGLLLWMGADLYPDPTQAMPLPGTIDLAIMTTPRDLENRRVDHATQHVPPAQRSPMPAPPQRSPHLAGWNPGTSQKVFTENMDKAVRARNEIRRKALAEVMRPPRPIRSWAGPIEELRIESQASEGQTMPPVTSTPSLRPNPDVHVSGIPASGPGRSEDLKLVPSTEGEDGLAPVGADLREAVPDYAVNPEPVYPRLAIRRNYEGAVLLMVEVLSDGSVREVRVLESSGHAILDRSALKAVQKWRFRPGTRGGKPVTMNVKVPVVFRLTKEGKG